MEIVLAPVTIVIPVLNELNAINPLLASIKAQSKKPNQIIFVDAGSNDGTQEEIKKWWKNNKWENAILTTLFKQGAFPGEARNYGIQFSNNQWIAFLDSGITPSIDWLEQLMKHVSQNQQQVAAFGLCIFESDSTIGLSVCAVSFGIGKMHAALPASLINKEVFNSVGHFREDLRAAEDLEWFNRFEQIYGPLPICRNAIVLYKEIPNSLWSVFIKWKNSAFYTFLSGVSKKVILLYLLTPFLYIVALSFAPLLSLIFFFLYLFIRGIISPIKQSTLRNVLGIYKLVPLMLLSAVIIDLAKFCGYLQALLFKFKSNR
jgi:glycosyltransferase involved in cell wall biosynthesis